MRELPRVDALKDAESRLAFLLELSDALRPLADPIAIQHVASRLLAERLQSDRAYYAEVDEAADTIDIHRDHVRGGAPTVVGHYRVSDFDWIGPAFRQRKTAMVDDTQDSHLIPEHHRAALSQGKIGSFIVAPLVKENRLVAALSVSNVRARRWTLAEAKVVEETAVRTWAAVERALAEAALRKSDLRARALLLEATTARAEAEAANRSKDEFLATLSHELRTPLAAILLWSGALRSGAVPVHELTRAIDAITQSAESQSRLIEDLLDLSRLTSGKLALSLEQVDAGAIARAAVDLVRPLAIAKKIDLAANISTGLDGAVMDSARLKQILWNVLGNAVKFTPAGGQVTLDARKAEGQLELDVLDTGQGITADFLPRVFEKFRQADMAETRHHMGLGIGLALTKELAELHGGSVEAESAGLGHGSLFRIRLPWIAFGADALVPSSTRARSSADDLALDDVRVLLVEDDLNTREAMGWTLTSGGAKVLSVGTASEALELLGISPAPAADCHARHVDVLVADLGLPEMSGYELMDRIVRAPAREGRPPPPACALSAHARDVDRLRALEAGFDMYLTKPVTSERLLEAVADLYDIHARSRHSTSSSVD